MNFLTMSLARRWPASKLDARRRTYLAGRADREAALAEHWRFTRMRSANAQRTKSFDLAYSVLVMEMDRMMDGSQHPLGPPGPEMDSALDEVIRTARALREARLIEKLGPGVEAEPDQPAWDTKPGEEEKPPKRWTERLVDLFRGKP